MIAFLVDAPAKPSIAPGSKPFLASSDWTYFTSDDGITSAIALRFVPKPIRIAVLARVTFKLSLADLVVNFLNQD